MFHWYVYSSEDAELYETESECELPSSYSDCESSLSSSRTDVSASSTDESTSSSSSNREISGVSVAESVLSRSTTETTKSASGNSNKLSKLIYTRLYEGADSTILDSLLYLFALRDCITYSELVSLKDTWVPKKCYICII